MKIFQRPLTWIVLCLLCALSATYAYRNFSKALPLLRLDIKMDRNAATAAAEALARTHKWSPVAEHKSVTLFTTNDNLTNFIELEAGGRENLGRLLEEASITPYRWTVRLYRENDASETSVSFKPDGTLAGFHEKLPESAPGAALGEAEARAIAEKAAPGYGIDLSSYKPIESKDNKTVSGRVDHSFTYERPSTKLGAGRDLVTLTVRGDRVSGVNTSVRIPDDFFRRYETMRSANTTIAIAASIVMIAGLALGGCISALIILGKKGGLEWRLPVIAAAVIGTLTLLAALNDLPLAWFNYDTAISSTNFITQRLLTAVISGFALFAFAALILTAAENLSREAFPSQPQLWRIFSGNAAASREVFGRVAAGYILSGLWFGYLVWVYSVGSTKLGWWMPSSPLSEPGILGTFAPWLAPVANALQAGVTEEALFRAVPLAWAAILGRRYGRSWLWIGVTLVLQAVVFGACHANYPNQPAWARLVELITPAMFFGVLYLLFGLVPGIIIHFFYDVILMALPILASHAPGSSVSSAIVLVLAVLPLAVVIFARLRAAKWEEFPEALRYRSWMARIAAPKPEIAEVQVSPLSVSTRRILLVVGALAAPIWLWVSFTAPDVPGISIRKPEAIAAAQRALEKEGIKLGSDWHPLAVAQSDSDQERKMVWQTSEEKTFKQLLGNYLSVPDWRVRYVRPELPLPDRAEEYVVIVGNDGKLVRFDHQVPEKRKGAQLGADEARTIAERELKRVFGFEASQLKVISSTEEKHPNRKDWLFIWSDPSITLKQGDARMWVRVQGDALGGHGRFVFIPEDWSRADRAKGMIRRIASGVFGFLIAMVCAAAIIAAVRDWIAARINQRAFFLVGAIYLVLNLVQIANNIPKSMVGFTTNEGFTLQLVRNNALLAVGAAIAAVLVGLWAGQQRHESLAKPDTNAKLHLGLGLATGMLIILVTKLISLTKPHDYPWHAGIDGANSGVLLLGGLWRVDSFLITTLCVLCVYHYLSKQFKAPRKRLMVFVALGLICGCAVNSDTWLTMGLSAVACALGFPLVDALIQRTHRSLLVPLLFSTVLTKIVMDFVLPGYPDSALSNAVSLIACGSAAWLVYRYFAGSEKSASTAPNS